MRPREKTVVASASGRISLTALSQHDSIASTAKARYHFNIMLRPEPEGGYTVLVLALPGCATYGRTVDEAREMAKDSVSGYIASLRQHKDPISTDDNTLVASLDQPFFHHKSSVHFVTDIEPTIRDNGDDLCARAEVCGLRRPPSKPSQSHFGTLFHSLSPYS